MSRMRYRTFLGATLAALGMSACVQAHHVGTRAGSLSVPIMPLAQGHIPPLPAQVPSASGSQTVIPMRIAQVSRRGRTLRVTWDAPGATSAIVSFSPDGSAFRTMGRTAEPAAEFTLPAAHGIIRVFVTDGKRRNAADYRI